MNPGRPEDRLKISPRVGFTIVLNVSQLPSCHPAVFRGGRAHKRSVLHMKILQQVSRGDAVPQIRDNDGQLVQTDPSSP